MNAILKANAANAVGGGTVLGPEAAHAAVDGRGKKVRAMLKVRLIGLHFMDLRVAPTPLRLLFEGYVLAVFAALAILDLVVTP